MAIHGGSDYKGFVVVPTSYQIDFEAQDSISIINKGQTHFLHKESYTHIMCLILVNVLVDNPSYECCATCLLHYMFVATCDLMLKFSYFYDNFCKITSSFWRTRHPIQRLMLHIVCSQVVMNFFLWWSYIGDIPTQSVPHFQMHYRRKSGIV